MTGTFTTRLRATLTAVGLLVALGTSSAQAADDLPVLPIAPTPGQATLYPTPGNPPPGYAPPGYPMMQGPPPGALPHSVVPLPDANGVVAPAPGCCGKEYSGGMGYLMSGCSAPGCTSSLWYARGEVLGMTRDIANPSDTIAFVNGGVISSGGLNNESFGIGGGLRGTFGIALIETSACDLFFEVTGLGLTTDGAEATFDSGLGLFFGTPFSPLLNDSVSQQTIRYSSTLESVEGNLKVDYYLDNSLYLLGGLRFIRFTDDFTLTDFGTLAGSNVNLSQRIRNNMLGVQVGFDWNLTDPTSPWGAQVYGRAGVYANFMEGNIALGGVNTTRGNFFNSERADRIELSAAFEGGLVGTWRFQPNATLRFGYHCIWLAEIGAAPDQPIPSFETLLLPSRLSSDQEIFYQGAILGLEIHWGCCR